MDECCNHIAAAKAVFDIEINALQKTRDALDADFEAILKLILSCKGKIIITGIGKPGHIGTKIAATLASLGAPSFFLHPAEALHGDLGMVEKEDVILLMSYSGESVEITNMIPALHEIGCDTVAITGKRKSTLYQECKYHFVFPEFEEACYLNLAPTSSTTALLVLGDALAVVASHIRNYTKEDFGLHHPGGALGRRLLTKVENVMHTGENNAVIRQGNTLRNAIVEMSAKGLSMVVIVDDQEQLKGLITDGDLRRMMERGVDVYGECVDDVMTKTPLWIDYREMAVNALQIMNEKKITCLPVLDEERRVIGAVRMQDILKAGIIE